MNEIDIAYIAAFLDTDGWITVVPRNKGTTYGVQSAIVNRHLGVLQWVQSIMGGSINPRNRSRKAPHAKNWTQTYDLNFRSSELERVLTTVLPYLRIKREQAELSLELLSTKLLIVEGRRQHKVSPEVQQRRHEIYKRVRELNWSGLDRSGLASL